MKARKLERDLDFEMASVRQHAIPRNALSPSIQFLYQPPRDEVARLAFEIYEARPDYPGRDWEDWFEAESILRLAAHVTQLSHVIQTTEADPPLTFRMQPGPH
jgi:hypothetical protein